MKLRLLAALCSVLFALPTLASPRDVDAAVPSEPESFQLREKTAVPNTTLQPGSYSIRILDHLRDRVILQVSGKGRVTSTFLAIPASTMANAPVGPIAYGSGPKGKAALKGFSFPGGVAVEFVYPKSDAVSIAQANDTRVMAIDPASEGRVPAEKLNQTDMQMITLWMLEPSRVGPADAKPGIAATRYQAPPNSPAAPIQTAQVQPVNSPATSEPTNANRAVASSTPSAVTASRAATRRTRPVQIAQNDTPAPPPVRTHVRPANVATLPHTASALPLIWIAALVSLFLGASLSWRRAALRS